MPIVHITFRRLYHTLLIKLHFADHTVTVFYCLYYMFMLIVTVYDSARP